MSHKLPRVSTPGLVTSVPPAGEDAPAPAPAQAASVATATPPAELMEDFYSLSAELTGFDETELRGTGVGDMYLEWLDRELPDVLRDLLAAWRAVVSAHAIGEREAGLRLSILTDARLGPFARAVLTLWYTATWVPPDWPWTPADGHTPAGVNRSFGAAYPEALLSRALVGGHRRGAKPTGFGSWAFDPREA